MARVRIRPINNKFMRCPDTGAILPPQGRKVELNTYWRRRLHEGAIEIVPGAQKAHDKKATQKDKSDKGDKA